LIGFRSSFPTFHIEEKLVCFEEGWKENYMTPMNTDPGNEVEGPNVIDETKPMNQAQEKRKSKKP
jgi:hypothetical protein